MGTHWVERVDPDRLRAARKQRGISQLQMAQRIGQLQSAYSRYETGKQKPTPRTLLKITEVLQAPLDDLLEPGPVDMVLLRARRGLTQAQVAAALGRSHVWYRRVEHRQTSIPPGQLAKLAVILGVKERELAALLLVRSTE